MSIPQGGGWGTFAHQVAPSPTHAIPPHQVSLPPTHAVPSHQVSSLPGQCQSTWNPHSGQVTDQQQHGTLRGRGRGKPKACFKCGDPSHIKKDCPYKGQGQQLTYTPSLRQQGSSQGALPPNTVMIGRERGSGYPNRGQHSLSQGNTSIPSAGGQTASVGHSATQPPQWRQSSHITGHSQEVWPDLGQASSDSQYPNSYAPQVGGQPVEHTGSTLANGSIALETYDQVIGGKPILDITIGGVKTTALFDTGSQVTTVTYSFYQDYLQPLGVQLTQGKWFELSGANGLEIPYIGLAVLDIEAMGSTLSQRGMLVMKDTPQVNKQRQDVPVILGMNVIGLLPEAQDLLGNMDTKHNKETVDSQEVHVQGRQEGCCGFARVATEYCVPAGTVCTVPVRVQASKSPVLVEGLQSPLPGNVVLANTLIDPSTGYAYVRVANFGVDDVYLPARTKIGFTSPVDDIEELYDDVKLDVQENKIIVSFVQGSTDLGDTVTSDSTLPEGVDLSGMTSSEDVRQEAVRMFHRHQDVFMSEENKGKTESIWHRIHLTDDIPVNSPYRRLPPIELQELKQHLKEQLKRKIISESTSPYSSAIVICRKKSGQIRLTVDYRKLNAKTVKDKFPLPRIDENLDALHGSKSYSVMDLSGAYDQVELHPQDRHKTAFITPLGLYHYNRMAQGLCNGPATMQRLMTNIFRDEIMEIMLIFLDDIIAYASSEREMIQTLDRIFTILRKHGLKLDPKKCHFFQREVKYVGVVVSEDGVKPDPEKVEAVAN